MVKDFDISTFCYEVNKIRNYNMGKALKSYVEKHPASKNMGNLRMETIQWDFVPGRPTRRVFDGDILIIKDYYDFVSGQYVIEEVWKNDKGSIKTS